MTPISFAFKSGISKDRQEAVLAQVQRLKGVQKVVRLDAASSNPVVQRMCHLYVGGDADPTEVVRQVNALPEIEYAERPPTRFPV